MVTVHNSTPNIQSYIARIGAEQLNFRSYVIRTYHGQYAEERVTIKITKEGDIICSSPEHEPTPEEAKAIKTEVCNSAWPRHINADNLLMLPVQDAGDDSLFIIYDRLRGGIFMVLQRTLIKDKKAYLPWTMWNDGVWRCMEPESLLLFWKPEKISKSRVMIHEGAKAARAAQMVADGLVDHPWKECLSRYEHWGMLGGALAPHKTDYDELRRHAPTEVVYVCDNDVHGKNILPKVSKLYGDALKGVKFDELFPVGWDMADPMPEKFFCDGMFNGLDLESYMKPATWATRSIPESKAFALNSAFAKEWAHVNTPEIYVFKDRPDKLFNVTDFNNHVRPYSDVDDTARLLKQSGLLAVDELAYDPSRPQGLIEQHKTKSTINTYVDGRIKPEAGDVGPWLELLTYFIPHDGDRLETCRWLATLVAKPEKRLLYGLLLAGEKQGVGKSTIGERVLLPLLGAHNVSTVTEEMIVDNKFNSWAGHKRLALIHEIYAGQSVKAYNNIKSYITEQIITINKKFQSEYTIENHVNIFACSNSVRALKMSVDDRRWLVPGVTEVLQSQKWWDDWYEWLERKHGLNIIMRWCHEFIEQHGYIKTGAHAPMSAAKQRLIDEGYSPGQLLAANALDCLEEKIETGDLPPDTFTTDIDLVDLIRNYIHEGRHNDKTERPATIRKLAKDKGWLVLDKRTKITAWGFKRRGCYVITRQPDLELLLEKGTGPYVNKWKAPVDWDGLINSF